MGKGFSIGVGLCLFLGGTPLLAQTASRCPVTLTYDAMAADSPDFFVRAGYSRDNDDPKEGSYETAVLDLELYGRKSPNAGKVCVYLSVSPILSSESENAGGWAKNFFLRQHSAYQLANQEWKGVNAPETFSRFTVVHSEQHPMFQNGKFGERSNKGRTTSLSSKLFLGEFADGVYAGRVYMQMATGTDKRGLPQFSNGDDSPYLVRHVVEWRLKLKDSAPIEPAVVVAEAGTKGDTAGFANSVRLITPKWHDTVVDSGGGRRENKKHHATLMWKDLLDRDPTTAGRAYQKWNQLVELNRAKEPKSDEEFGRLPPKR